MSETSRQLAAIMFTDIVGYTALMGEDEEKAFELLEKNRVIQRPIIERYNGRWLKEMGDGVLASFSTVSDAVYCAGAIQEACRKEDDLKLRIGIHQGEVVFKGEDVFGDGVNIASRLEPLAPIGGILVSESVARNIENKKGIETKFLREETLKNVKHPVKIYQVEVEIVEPPDTIPESSTLASSEAPQSKSPTRKIFNQMKVGLVAMGGLVILGLAYMVYNSNSNTTGIEGTEPLIIDKSIAVLPFKNLSEEKGNQYFADGIQEAILNHLSKIGALKVISRTSVEQYRETTKPINQIGQELQVGYILEGSAQKSGDKVRITVQLIGANQDDHLWAENYDRQLNDIFSTQSEIAERIASELEAKLNPEEKELIRTVPTSNLMAYDYFLRAQEYLHRYTDTRLDQDYMNAVQLFRQSLENDPQFATAYVGMAQIYFERNFFSQYFVEDPMDSVLILCNRALEINPNLADAYVLRGRYHQYVEGFGSKAKNDLLQALILDPNNYQAYGFLGGWNWQEKDFPEALRNFNQASKLVRGKDRIEFNEAMTLFYLSLWDYEKAKELIDNTIKLEPDNIGAWAHLAHLNRCLGQWELNLSIAEKIKSMDRSGAYASDLGIIYMMNGDYAESEKYFKKYHSLSPDKLSLIAYDDLHMFAYTLIKNGKTEDASQRLKQAEDYFLTIVAKNRPRARRIGYELAKVYALMGNKDEALKWLRHYEQNGFEVGLHKFARYDPPLESLWGDPEFEAILQRATEKIDRERIRLTAMQKEGLL